MNLIDAIQQKDTMTENGMTTNSSSLKHCVNLFFSNRSDAWCEQRETFRQGFESF